MTAAIPIVMPSTVRILRTLFPRSAETAEPSRAAWFIGLSSGNHSQYAQHGVTVHVRAVSLLEHRQYSGLGGNIQPFEFRVERQDVRIASDWYHLTQLQGPKI